MPFKSCEFQHLNACPFRNHCSSREASGKQIPLTDKTEWQISEIERRKSSLLHYNFSNYLRFDLNGVSQLCLQVQVVGKKLRNCTAFNNIVAVEVFEICERDFIKCRFRLLNKSFKQRKHFMFCLDLNRVATFVFAPFGPLCVVVALPKLNRMRTMEKIEFNFRIVVHNIARSISGLILRSCRRRAARRRYIMRTPSAIYIRQKRSGTQRSPI